MQKCFGFIFYLRINKNVGWRCFSTMYSVIKVSCNSLKKCKKIKQQHSTISHFEQQEAISFHSNMCTYVVESD